MKETAKSSPLPHIFSDIVVDKCNLTKLVERIKEHKNNCGTNNVESPLWLPYSKLNKVAASITKAVASKFATPPMQSFIHVIMKRDTLLKLYINNFIKVIAKPSNNEQMFILSKLQNFLNKVVGKISIQSFINRYTKQSIQLLPAY